MGRHSSPSSRRHRSHRSISPPPQEKHRHSSRGSGSPDPPPRSPSPRTKRLRRAQPQREREGERTGGRSSEREAVERKERKRADNDEERDGGEREREGAGSRGRGSEREVAERRERKRTENDEEGGGREREREGSRGRGRGSEREAVERKERKRTVNEEGGGREREREGARGRERGSEREEAVERKERKRSEDEEEARSLRSRHERLPENHRNGRSRHRSQSPQHHDAAASSKPRDELTNSRGDEQMNDENDSIMKMKATEEALEEKQKQKPSFELSGNLAAETNRFRGVTLLFNEPPEARKPDVKWRLYVFRGGEVLNEPLYIHRQSCYLFGRERRVADIPTDHPSCSKQHAVIQFRQVETEQSDGMLSKQVRPYIMDLGSTNKTFLNESPIEPQRYYELREKDTIKFGNSSREYVLLHENSAG